MRDGLLTRGLYSTRRTQRTQRLHAAIAPRRKTQNPLNPQTGERVARRRAAAASRTKKPQERKPLGS